MTQSVFNMDLDAVGKIIFTVINQGMGIQRKTSVSLSKLFLEDDSSSLKEAKIYGLDISNSIVKELDGSIGFRTMDGKGTAFSFCVPLHQAIDN